MQVSVEYNSLICLRFYVELSEFKIIFINQHERKSVDNIIWKNSFGFIVVKHLRINQIFLNSYFYIFDVLNPINAMGPTLL